MTINAALAPGAGLAAGKTKFPPDVIAASQQTGDAVVDSGFPLDAGDLLFIGLLITVGGFVVFARTRRNNRRHRRTDTQEREAERWANEDSVSDGADDADNADDDGSDDGDDGDN